MGVHDTHPIVGGDVFVAPNASVIGDVTLGSGSSVWYGAILRGTHKACARGPRELFSCRRGGHSPLSAR